jgi:hypothetical protein
MGAVLLKHRQDGWVGEGGCLYLHAPSHSAPRLDGAFRGNRKHT